MLTMMMMMVLMMIVIIMMLIVMLLVLMRVMLHLLNVGVIVVIGACIVVGLRRLTTRGGWFILAARLAAGLVEVLGNLSVREPHSPTTSSTLNTNANIIYTSHSLINRYMRGRCVVWWGCGGVVSHGSHRVDRGE
uniref:Uncharacterized protein n=1 Tax=Cacopsylla melanoneura TaxID=428564 RepID=A0A8D8V761_9HEMI